MAFGAAAVALFLDAFRRYAATSAIALTGAYSAYAAAAIVLLPFVLQVGATAMLARWSSRRAVLAASAVFAVAARAAPFVDDTTMTLLVSGLACLAGATLLSMLVASSESAAGSDASGWIALGLIVDVTRRMALGTLDIAELPGTIGLFIAALEVAIFLGLLITHRSGRAVALRSPKPIAIAAIPLAFTIAELIGTNGPRVAAAAGLGLADSHGLGVAAIGTVAVAVGMAAGVLLRGSAARWLAVSELLAGTAILALRVPTFGLAGGALLSCGIVLSLRLLMSALGEVASSARVAAAMAVGWFASFAVLLGYYVPYVFTPALWSAVAGVAGAVLMSRPPVKASLALRVAALIAVVVPLAVVVVPSETRRSDVGGTVRLMTYNLHFGFDYRQVPSLDRIAETIASESPDVVVLQEVMRGSALAVQHDALGWLAGRLGMSYVFAPTVGDFFGNAVLTRLPIDAEERLSFVRPSPLRHSPRGALLVRIAGVSIIVTHLDEYPDAASEAVRSSQVMAILARWGATPPPIVVAGDLNALPDSPPIAMLKGAGFADLGAEAGATIPAVAAVDRIDYVFAKGLTASDARVLPSAASDHRPLVVDLVLPRT